MNGDDGRIGGDFDLRSVLPFSFSFSFASPWYLSCDTQLLTARWFLWLWVDLGPRSTVKSLCRHITDARTYAHTASLTSMKNDKLHASHNPADWDWSYFTQPIILHVRPAARPAVACLPACLRPRANKGGTTRGSPPFRSRPPRSKRRPPHATQCALDFD